MCMTENIRYKTLYLLSQKKLHEANYVNHILENHKENISEDLKDHSNLAILQ